MDLPTVRAVRLPRTRDELEFAPGAVALGGGTWLFSERQEGLTELIDLTALGWEPWHVEENGDLVVAATCTLAELLRIPGRPEWRGRPPLPPGGGPPRPPFPSSSNAPPRR